MTREVALRKVTGYLTDYFSILDYNEVEEIMSALEQQPCKDCISRESVIEWLKDKDIIKTKNQEENVRRELGALPSVTPQPKTGHWILCHPLQADDPGAYTCSVCGCGDWGLDPKIDKFCFNCGAKMIEPSESEE